MTTSTPSSHLKRLVIVAGDPSGDHHGAKVIEALKQTHPDIEIAGIGGPEMERAGQHQTDNQAQMGRVGLGSFLAIPQHMAMGKRLLEFMQDFQPQLVLHIDYGMFNLWLAGQIKKTYPHVKTCHYIPPQVWASRRGRIQKIKRVMDHVCCIFPFETSLYEENQIPVTYVGHPLAGQLPEPPAKATFFNDYGFDPSRPLIALFPGSRNAELDYHLEPMLEAIQRLNKQRKEQAEPPVQVGLAVASHFNQQALQQRIEKIMNTLNGSAPSNIHIELIPNTNRHALQALANAAIIKSGTSTLETALYQTPMTIVYKSHWLAGVIAKRLAYYPVLGLPNILVDPYQPIVSELLMEDMNADNMARELTALLNPESLAYQKAIKGYQTIQNLMPTESAAQNVAKTLERIIGHYH